MADNRDVQMSNPLDAADRAIELFDLARQMCEVASWMVSRPAGGRVVEQAFELPVERAHLVDLLMQARAESPAEDEQDFGVAWGKLGPDLYQVVRLRSPRRRSTRGPAS
jgi:hypothetical protein